MPKKMVSVLSYPSTVFLSTTLAVKTDTIANDDGE